MYNLELSSIERLILEMSIDGYFDSNQMNSVSNLFQSDPTHFERVNEYGEIKLYLYYSLSKLVEEELADDIDFDTLENLKDDEIIKTFIQINFENYRTILNDVKNRIRLEKYKK